MLWAKTLDDYLIDRVFQRFARWTQISFGIDSIQWARFSAVGGLIACLVFVMIFLNIRALPRMTPLFVLALKPVLFMLAAMMILRCFNQLRKADSLERQYTDPQGEQKRNPFRWQYLETRIYDQVSAWISSGIFSIIPVQALFWLALAIWLALVAEYFLASEPLPPAKNRLRKWLEAWLKVRGPALNH